MQKISQIYNHVCEFLEPSFKKHENNLILKTITPDQFYSWLHHPVSILWLKIDQSQYEKNCKKAYLNPGKVRHLCLALYEIAFKATVVSLIAGVIVPCTEHLVTVMTNPKQHPLSVGLLVLGSILFFTHPLVLTGLCSPLTAALAINALSISAGHITQGIGHLISLFDEVKGLKWIHRGNLLLVDFLKKRTACYDQEKNLADIFHKNRPIDSLEKLKSHLAIGFYANRRPSAKDEGSYNNVLCKLYSGAFFKLFEMGTLYEKLEHVTKMADTIKVERINFYRRLFFAMMNEAFDKEWGSPNEEQKSDYPILKDRVRAHEMVMSNKTLIFCERVYFDAIITCKKGNKCKCQKTRDYHIILWEGLEEKISEQSGIYSTDEKFAMHVRVALFYRRSFQEKSSYLQFLARARKNEKSEIAKKAEEVFKELLPYHLDWIKENKSEFMNIVLCLKQKQKEWKLSIPKPLIKMIIVEWVKANLGPSETYNSRIHNVLFG